MTLHEALDECTICDLFNKDVLDEHKMQVIDKVISAPNTTAPKVKLCNIITWLLKKVKWQEQQIEEMKCCQNCKHFDFDEPKYCHKGVYNCAYVCGKWELGN
jgi:hypothetical protein